MCFYLWEENFIIKTFDIKNSCIYVEVHFSSVFLQNVYLHFQKAEFARNVPNTRHIIHWNVFRFIIFTGDKTPLGMNDFVPKLLSFTLTNQPEALVIKFEIEICIRSYHDGMFRSQLTLMLGNQKLSDSSSILNLTKSNLHVIPQNIKQPLVKLYTSIWYFTPR